MPSPFILLLSTNVKQYSLPHISDISFVCLTYISLLSKAFLSLADEKQGNIKMTDSLLFPSAVQSLFLQK